MLPGRLGALLGGRGTPRAPFPSLRPRRSAVRGPAVTRDEDGGALRRVPGAEARCPPQDKAWATLRRVARGGGTLPAPTRSDGRSGEGTRGGGTLPAPRQGKARRGLPPRRMTRGGGRVDGGRGTLAGPRPPPPPRTRAEKSRRLPGGPRVVKWHSSGRRFGTRPRPQREVVRERGAHPRKRVTFRV